MLRFPDFDPVALQIGPVAVHWYGLAYLGGFACAWWLGRQRARQAWRGWAPEQVDDLVFYCALGVIFGGRIGYALFYDLAEVIASPLRILRIWEGGMSFHGGLLGVLAAGALFGRKQGKGFFAVGDFVAPLVPLGLAFGRLGNFVNGELWGRVSDLPWAMVFPDPRAGDLARHPTQLYQAALEGLTLFVILWLFTRRERPAMAASGVFLLGYGAFRFLVELVRMPDAHIGYLAGGWLTLGQTLTMPMLAVGVGLLVLAYRRRADATAAGGGGVSR